MPSRISHHTEVSDVKLRRTIEDWEEAVSSHRSLRREASGAKPRRAAASQRTTTSHYGILAPSEVDVDMPPTATQMATACSSGYSDLGGYSETCSEPSLVYSAGSGSG